MVHQSTHYNYEPEGLHQRELKLEEITSFTGAPYTLSIKKHLKKTRIDGAK